MAVSQENNTNWQAVILGKGRFPDTVIPKVMINTSRLELTTSLYSLPATGIWDFSTGEFGYLLENRLLSVGTEIEFAFASPNAKYQVINMSILSINSAPGTSAQYISNSYSLTLISPWYFSDIVKSQAYTGTVSQIIYRMINDDFPKDTFRSTSILNSSLDSPNIRYRTYQTFFRFVQDNLIMKAKGFLETAMFYFTNIFNELQGLSLYDMRILPKWKAIDNMNPRKAQFADELLDDEKSKMFFYMLGFNVGINTSPNKALWHLVYPALVMTDRVTGLAIPGDKDPKFSALTNNYEKPYVYVNADRMSLPSGKQYMDDSLRSYETIYTESIQQYTRDLMKENEATMAGYFNFNIQPGRLCDVIINNQNDNLAPSAFEQTYIISKVSHIFVGNKGTTHVTLSAPAFEYEKDAKEVAGLVAMPPRK